MVNPDSQSNTEPAGNGAAPLVSLVLDPGEAPAVAVVEAMRYGDILNAVRNTTAAIHGDPTTRYLDSADTAPGREIRQKLVYTVDFVDNIYTRSVWTVNHGDAILTLGLPGNKRGPFMPFLTPVLKRFDTEELIKRKKELMGKLVPMLKAAFGDKIGDLIEVKGLATAPEKQGRGYGTALMLFVNALADAQQSGVWLLTSNTHTFYQMFGYTIVQEEFIGTDNPKWAGDPIPLRIMFRAPAGLVGDSSEKSSPL